MQDIRLPKIPVGKRLKRDGSGSTHNQPVMLVREEVVFAAHVGHLQESQALSSERLGSPALYFPVQSDPLEKGYRLCARACLITADLYTTIGMVSSSDSTGTIKSRSIPSRTMKRHLKSSTFRLVVACILAACSCSLPSRVADIPNCVLAVREPGGTALPM